MALEIEDARRASELRLQMVTNIQKGLAAAHDIDKEELKDILMKVRTSRTLGDTTGSKAKAKAPLIPVDIDALFKAK